AVISLLAFIPLVIYAAGLGMMPAVVAMPAVILQLILAVALSRVVTSVMRKLTRSQLSSALGAMVTGAIMAFFISGWMVLDADYNIMTLELPARLSTLLNVLPSSWGTAAIEAARSGQWAFSIAYLAGMVLVILLLRSLWAILLVKRLTTKPQRNRLSSKPDSPYGFFANRTGTVARKELIAWGRDYTRSGFVYFALFYSIFLCLYPVSAGNLFLLPWTGAIFVITAAGSTANLYGSDGSALWMTLVTSQAERYDIRGRQLAWLLIIAPPALIITFAMIFISGYYWAVPLALPLIIAALGAGAGLVVLNSVHRLEPMTDAHKRGDDMFDHPIGWWQFMSLMLVTLVLIAPA
ncbi:hypothetical protein K0U00_39555, partial [Paenibacillus sepulcri]|nr:hypothetical protein [Paenibacillus sepulcri]